MNTYKKNQPNSLEGMLVGYKDKKNPTTAGVDGSEQTVCGSRREWDIKKKKKIMQIMQISTPDYLYV